MSNNQTQDQTQSQSLSNMRAERDPIMRDERDPIMRYFTFDHLPEGPLRETSRVFCTTAEWVEQNLPRGAERSTALRKLLEGKDAAVRAALT